MPTSTLHRRNRPSAYRAIVVRARGKPPKVHMASCVLAAEGRSYDVGEDSCHVKGPDSSRVYAAHLSLCLVAVVLGEVAHAAVSHVAMLLVVAASAGGRIARRVFVLGVVETDGAKVLRDDLLWAPGEDGCSEGDCGHIGLEAGVSREELSDPGVHSCSGPVSVCAVVPIAR